MNIELIKKLIEFILICEEVTDELEKLTRDDSGLAVVISLKEAAKKKMRLKITGFFQAEYWYASSNEGCIMTYNNYNISKEENIKIEKIGANIN